MTVYGHGTLKENVNKQAFSDYSNVRKMYVYEDVLRSKRIIGKEKHLQTIYMFKNR